MNQSKQVVENIERESHMHESISEFKTLLESNEQAISDRISNLESISSRLSALRAGRFVVMFEDVCEQVKQLQALDSAIQKDKWYSENKQLNYDQLNWLGETKLTILERAPSISHKSANNTLIDENNYEKERNHNLNETYDSLTSLDVDVLNVDPLEAVESLSSYLSSVSLDLKPSVHNNFLDLLVSVRDLTENTPPTSTNSGNLKDMILLIERSVGAFVSM